jgi:hypothetical protein
MNIVKQFRSNQTFVPTVTSTLRGRSRLTQRLPRGLTRGLTLLCLVALGAGCTPSPGTQSPTPTPTPSAASQTPLPPPPTPVALQSSPPSNKPEITRQIESKLTELVSGNIGVPLESIDCPAKTERKPGDRFDCRLSAQGQSFLVGIELTDAAGKFKWNTQGLLVLSKLEAFIQQRLKEKDQVEVKANCGGKIRVTKPNEEFQCQITDVQGQARTIKISVKDDQGNVDVLLQ